MPHSTSTPCRFFSQRERIVLQVPDTDFRIRAKRSILPTIGESVPSLPLRQFCVIDNALTGLQNAKTLENLRHRLMQITGGKVTAEHHVASFSGICLPCGGKPIELRLDKRGRGCAQLPTQPTPFIYDSAQEERSETE